MWRSECYLTNTNKSNDIFAVRYRRLKYANEPRNQQHTKSASEIPTKDVNIHWWNCNRAAT
jgi:hypothetical protein